MAKNEQQEIVVRIETGTRKKKKEKGNNGPPGLIWLAAALVFVTWLVSNLGG